MNIQNELTRLHKLTPTQLQERYAEVFGQTTASRHKQYLIRKIAWRLQANAEGDLSERARRRAMELANDADVRAMPPKNAMPLAAMPDAGPHEMDPRLPSTGTWLTRDYKGGTVRVLVKRDGFEYDGEHYNSLTAVAKIITGSHMNGFRFFRLEQSS